MRAEEGAWSSLLTTLPFDRAQPTVVQYDGSAEDCGRLCECARVSNGMLAGPSTATSVQDSSLQQKKHFKPVL